MKEIIISVYPVDSNKNAVVRLGPEAQEKINQLQMQRGLSTTYIVSEIIKQAADYVVFKDIKHGDIQMP